MKNVKSIATVAALMVASAGVGYTLASPRTSYIASDTTAAHDRVIAQEEPTMPGDPDYVALASMNKYVPITDRLIATETTTCETTAAMQSTMTEATETTVSAMATATAAAIETEPVTTIPTEMPTKPVIRMNSVNVETVSVSCLRINYDCDRAVNFNVDTDAPFADKITFVDKGDGVMYLTGLRENSEYKITASPIPNEGEDVDVEPAVIYGHTEAVEVIYEFDYVDGWTGCFAGERASGLTAMPSSGAIYGSHIDDITGTTIRRFDNGDYCVAMGTHYGFCGDRFLVEMNNGAQFTVRICDSKGEADVQDADGYGMWHWFGGSGKCIIEMIYNSDGEVPGCVRTSGSWGGWNWNGLDLGGDIASIKMINY